MQQRGHDVRVLTGFPNYPGGRLYPGYRIRPFRTETMDGVRVHRAPLYPSHDTSRLGRIANYLSFALSAAVAALFLRRPDVVYLYHPPGTAALPALVVKLFRGVPFVLDVQDLWPDTLAATGMMSNPRILGLVDRWMAFVYRQSAHVGVLSPGFRQRLIQRGVPAEKITVIPNWTYEPDEEATKPATELSREPSHFNILFAGNMGPAQALETVLEAAAILQNSLPHVRFHFIGGGLQSATLRSLRSQRQLANVRFHDRVPPYEMPAILRQADMVLVHLKDDPLFSITIPSKTQAYMRAGRAILMGVRGDAAALVEKAEAGFAFEPENAASLVQAVCSAVASPPEMIVEMGRSAESYYRRELALEVGTKRWLEMLGDAALLRARTLGLKRVFDFLLSSLLLIILSPIMLIVATLVRFKLGAPILFSHQRPGQFGAPFDMLKFRSMTDERGSDGEPLPDRDRLTPFGAWLRTTSLDELPSLWNVLKGDMSFVGPRPLLVRYTPYFRRGEMPRLLVRPGITGWAQINGRNHAPWDERLAMDAWYVRNWSLALDLRILIRTALKVIRREDIAPDPRASMLNLDEERKDMPNDRA